MVKRILILLGVFLLLVTPLSFAKEVTIVDEDGYLDEEESAALRSFLENLQKAYNLEASVLLITPEKDVEETEEVFDYLLEKYPLGQGNYIRLAYNIENQVFYGYSQGFEELTSDVQQKVLNEIVSLDLGNRAANYINLYFSKLVPYLGTPSVADALPTPGVVPEKKQETETAPETKVEPQQGKEVEAKVYLEDKAGLWSEEEKAKLLHKAEEISKREDVAIVLATTDDNPKASSEAYIDDLTDEHFGVDTNQVGFLIDMDKRKVHIGTSGKAIDILDDARIEAILDVVFTQGMEKKDYFKAADVMLDETATYLAQGVHADYEGRKERTEPNSINLVDGLAGLGLAGGSGLGFFGRVKKRYGRKVAPLAFQYQNNLIGGVVPEGGKLIDRRVTTRVIPKSSGGGGSSGGHSSTTHSSSSGGTHGGGGRSF